ncbi:MAG: ATP-binding protein [Siculibacillus sp.]|nr:ATP-binding protein [Siculibacillus sp.]
MTTGTADPPPPSRGTVLPAVVARLRRTSITGRIGLVVGVNVFALLALAAAMAWSGGELRRAWVDLRLAHDVDENLFALERSMHAIAHEVAAFLDKPDESRRTEYEAAKARFTAVLLRTIDHERAARSTVIDEFVEVARHYLFAFDDLRGLEIDIRLIYENEFADLVPRVRERLDALDAAIRPTDAALRPLVATAYDHFAEFRVNLVAYRHDRRSELLETARRARDTFAAALREIGRSPSPDARGYAIERFTPEIVAMDSIFDRLIDIAERHARWLGGTLESNRTRMTTLLQSAVDRQSAREREAIERFDRLLGAAAGGFAVVAAGFALLSLIASLLVARTIRAPLAAARTAMRAVVAGEHDQPVPGLDAVDEIGAVSRSIEVFRREVAGIRRREEEHGARERRWYGMLETSPIGIAILAAGEGRPIFHNHRWDELFGDPAGGGEPTRPHDGFAEADDAVRLSAAAARVGGVSGWQALMRRRDGGIWWGMLDVRPIEFAGRPAHVFWIYDVTDRREAEEDMRRAKEKAETALRDLAEAQRSLIEAEKLAAIGGLVAGVAHEVNNPVGIGLTVASSLERRVALFDDELASGQVRRSRLDEFVESARDAARQLVANLTRAGELVQSFKQVAVDRTHSERRAFDLAAATEQIAASLRPGLRATGVTFEVEVPTGLGFDSHPGAWGQVVTNLFVNALTHAWPEGTPAGRMTLTAAPCDGERVEIVFADDGVGMDEDVARRAFDPFFTTRRGAGGSGLGLHIVYNIVTHRLGGRIALDTAPGRGCRFRITLPKSAPADEAEPGRGRAREGAT